MTDVIVIFLIGILGIIEILIMAVGVFCLEIQQSKLRRLFFIGSVFLSGIIEVICNFWESNLMMIICIIMTPLSLFIGLKNKKRRIIAVYLCSLTYVALPYFCIDMIVANRWGYDYVENNYSIYAVIRSLTTIVLVTSIIIFLRKDKTYEDKMKKLPVRFLAIQGVCAICGGIMQETYVLALSLFEKGRERVTVSIALVIVILVFYSLGMIIAYIFGLKEQYREENRKKDEYLRMSKEYIQLVKENAKETRKIRHDMSNHINVINEYLCREQYQKAKEYVATFQEHMNQKISKVSVVGNETVDAVITSYMNQEEVEDIKWNVCGKIPVQMYVTDFELCTLFSNLLSNGVEACKKVEKSKRFINIDIKRTEEQLVIEVENSVAEIVPIETLGKITPKADKKNHGLGIKNILEVVEKSKGQILFENDEQAFRTRIVLDLQ